MLERTECVSVWISRHPKQYPKKQSANYSRCHKLHVVLICQEFVKNSSVKQQRLQSHTFHPVLPVEVTSWSGFAYGTNGNERKLTD